MRIALKMMGVLCFSLCICLPGCARTNAKNARLAAPANLSVSVTGRLMTVSWDAVDNASGYIIHTASAGCTSGNRIVNTADKTVTNHAGARTNSRTAETGITIGGNGFVTFTGATSFTIWLMAETDQDDPNDEVMTRSLTVKAMSVGDGADHLNSGYSTSVTINKDNYN